MALVDAGTEEVNAPSPSPNESKASIFNGSLTPTAATAPASNPLDLPNVQESKKEDDSLEEQNGEIPGQNPLESAGARSPSPLPRSISRHSSSDEASDSDEALEDRILRAPRQRRMMARYTRYTRLMEDRVKALETKVGCLEAQEENKKPSVSTSAAKKDSLEKFKVLNSINRVNETEYKKNSHRHLIEVLIKDNVDVVLDKDHQSDTSETQKPAGRLLDTTTTTTPDRIRINSFRLLVELDSVTDQDTQSVFLPPYTFFTTYEQKLRDHVEVLEKKSRGEDVAIDTENGAGGGAEKTDLDNGASAQSQQPPLTSRGALDDAETKDLPSTDANSQTSKKDEATHGAENAHSIDDTEEDEVDEGDLAGEDIVAVMENCQVSRRKAAKALEKEGGSWVRASSELLKSMTKEEKKRADAAKAGFLLQSWTTLVRLMDTYLRPKIELVSRISKKTLKEIAYEDLGYLFKPGDVVLASQDQRLQALAVLATTGGRKLFLDTQVRRADDPEYFFHASEGHSPFVVDCFYYDFDGTNYGAILRSITIPKYEGKTQVNRLAVYPESLSGDANRDLKMILGERGKKFVQLCSLSAAAHRMYGGRTLDDVPEEVDSQVIIDCRMAAIVDSDQRPDKAQWMPALGMTKPTEPDLRELNDAHDCDDIEDCGICDNRRNSAIFNHHRFDRQRSREYVTSEEIVNRPFGESELHEHQFMLLPFRVFGFVLCSRKWGKNSPK